MKTPCAFSLVLCNVWVRFGGAVASLLLGLPCKFLAGSTAFSLPPPPCGSKCHPHLLPWLRAELPDAGQALSSLHPSGSSSERPVPAHLFSPVPTDSRGPGGHWAPPWPPSPHLEEGWVLAGKAAKKENKFFLKDHLPRVDEGLEQVLGVLGGAVPGPRGEQAIPQQGELGDPPPQVHF